MYRSIILRPLAIVAVLALATAVLALATVVNRAGATLSLLDTTSRGVLRMYRPS